MNPETSRLKGIVVAGDWKIDQLRLEAAANLAESITKGLGITTAPVNPFCAIEAEGKRIIAFGDDFGDAFDGRIEYQSPRFLLFYNTKYNAWPHDGIHHPKIIFTVAHELGHYFLERHRNYLKRGGQPHGSKTDFVSNNVSEREADAFAAGLLMPRYIANPIINAAAPTLALVKAARKKFDVSLTSMLVRWVQLSDFPCAVCSVSGGAIEWGFTSEAFKEVGAYKVNRGKAITSKAAQKFLALDRSLSAYREGEGWSEASHWLDFDRHGLFVAEYFVVIPSTHQVLVFLTADEDDVHTREEDGDFGSSDDD